MITFLIGMGFLSLICVLSYCTFIIWFVGTHGGYEFSFIGIGNLWWYIPLVCVVISAWVWLVIHTPFTLVIP